MTRVVKKWRLLWPDNQWEAGRTRDGVLVLRFYGGAWSIGNASMCIKAQLAEPKEETKP